MYILLYLVNTRIVTVYICVKITMTHLSATSFSSGRAVCLIIPL